MGTKKKSSKSKKPSKHSGKEDLGSKKADVRPRALPKRQKSAPPVSGRKTVNKGKGHSFQGFEPQAGFPIVGIGASAGGLEAFEEFFTQMPPDSGLAFVVVPHQSPGHTSLLPGLLQKCTAMNVLEVTDGLKVKPDTVYLALAGKNLAILNGALHLMEPVPQERVLLPIDYFFRSLAEDQRHRAIGIILSGTGSDGTLGLKAIKGETGMTMAQEPQSAKYPGMPSSAMAIGVVDFVCTPSQMPAQILAYIRGPYLGALPPSVEADSSMGQFLQKVFVILRERTGNDFSLYKENTIRRRIERRMNVHQIDAPQQYLRYLLATPHEVDALFQEMLIGVTSFFRDPKAFEVLGAEGIPSILDDKEEGAQIRVWVAGCGSGEEAYSIAILIREYMARRKIRFQVQVFGTDLDARAIEAARRGVYPAGIANDVTPERLKQFFSKDDGDFRVRKEIRDMVIFAPHNLLNDPPFTKLDLLSCRNLLIYLEGETQRRLLPLFSYSLKPDGLLFLGSSETVGEFGESLFASLDRKWKLYRRKTGEAGGAALEGFPLGGVRAVGEMRDREERPLLLPTPSTTGEIEAMLLERYAPASVIVNQRGEVVYIQGRTGAYLNPPPAGPACSS